MSKSIARLAVAGGIPFLLLMVLLTGGCAITQPPGGTPYAANSPQCLCECHPARGSYTVQVRVNGQRASCACRCDQQRGYYSYWANADGSAATLPAVADRTRPVGSHAYRGKAPTMTAPPAQSGLPPVISSRYPSATITTPGVPAVSAVGVPASGTTAVPTKSTAPYRVAANDYANVRRDALRSAKRRSLLRKKRSSVAKHHTKHRSQKTDHKGKTTGKATTKPSSAKKKTGGNKGSKKYKVLGKWYYPLDTAIGYSEVGMASWYGKRFQGAPTASGEKFDMNKLTAAHRTLPFGSKVKVTNIETGSNVIVRINDRGPFSEDRLIDVSAAAADRLGFGGKGMIKVKVEGVSD